MCYEGVMLLLVHVEVPFEDPLLHGIGYSGLLGHVAGGWLHDSNALGSLVRRLRDIQGLRSGDGTTFSTRAKVLCKIVSFACMIED